MSKEYRQQVKLQHEASIERQLEDAPYFVVAYYEHMHNGSREITTQLAYIRDVMDFLRYIASVTPELKEIKLSDFPISVISALTIQDINEYRDYLFTERELSNSAALKKLAALSTFFKYMCLEGDVEVNPMTNFEFPAVNKHRIVKLDADLSKQLLKGILENDKYLATSEYGEFVGDIPPKVWLKRERTVLRNYAIVFLLLGTGLRVSELVGLDLSDINFANNTIHVIVKGGDENDVVFGDDVAEALKLYINGPTLSPALSAVYSPVSDVAQWAKNHINDDKLSESIFKSFPNLSSDELSALVELVSHYRRHGRDGFKPARNCEAVFLSNRGTRLTVRMVELMMKELVKTYLPDYDDKDIFSPHKLRATCASRILTQTGDIELASTQLNHKSVGVTAAFYAELQKEKRKEKLKNLDVTEW